MRRIIVSLAVSLVLLCSVLGLKNIAVEQAGGKLPGLLAVGSAPRPPIPPELNVGSAPRPPIPPELGVGSAPRPPIPPES